jgi:hypothetical protein
MGRPVRRRWRWLVLLLFAYVALDLASPQMPGAFSFELTDSVEALRGDRLRDDAPAPDVPGLGPPLRVDPRPPSPGTTRPLAAAARPARWLRPAVRPRAPDSPPPSEED